MRVVEDGAGRRHLLLKRSGASSLVRDVETGRERFLPNDELVPCEGIDVLAAAAAGVPKQTRRALPTRDDRAVGLLALLVREPRAARTLLDATDLCESDLLGVTTELRAAGLLTETTVEGERGYAATEEAQQLLAADQSADASTAEGSD